MSLGIIVSFSSFLLITVLITDNTEIIAFIYRYYFKCKLKVSLKSYKTVITLRSNPGQS